MKPNQVKAYYIKEIKKQKHKVQIRVSGHEYSFAYIGPICNPVVFVYACACSKHVYAYTS